MRLPASNLPAKNTNMSARRHWFRELPLANRALLLSGGTLLGLCVLSVVLPPVGSGIALAVHPYTAGGKQEACLSNLQQLNSAMQLYLSDSDKHYPPLDNNAQGASRVTWVTLLGRRTDTTKLQCPLLAVSDARVQSSYGLNPVLGSGNSSEMGGAGRSEVAHPESVLLLSDRGSVHDVSLLPPFPGWQQVTGAGTTDCGVTDCNLAFPHQDTASVLFADGHADSRSAGDWLGQTGTWGGSLALRRALERVQSRDPLLKQVAGALEKNDEAAATALLKANLAQTRTALVPVLTLWQRNQTVGENGSGSDDSSNQSDTVEVRAWQLARLSRDAGESTLTQAMQAGLSRRSKEMLQAVQNGTWQHESSDAGFSLERPSGWTLTTSPEGRYTRIYLRSGSPWVSVQVEVGTRVGEGASTSGPVEWTGMEHSFQERWKSRYSRVEMQTDTLGGEEAGLWSFTVERDGEPRLQKLYVGRGHYDKSFVLVCTAPAQDWAQWQPVFARIQQSLSF